MEYPDLYEFPEGDFDSREIAIRQRAVNEGRILDGWSLLVITLTSFGKTFMPGSVHGLLDRTNG
jgi:hypothetical protein